VRFDKTGPPGPRYDDGRGPETSTTAPKQSGRTTDYSQHSALLSGSQQVTWWDVYTFCRSIIRQILDPDEDDAGRFIARGPVAGTPQWAALDDDDPLKLAACLAYSPHHALRIEAAQTGRAEASQDISAAADWGAVGNRIREYREWMDAHLWARRTA
jgi:hypothetical protein